MEPKRENLSVFGAATNMPSFGGQGSHQLNSATSSAFGGSFVFGTPAATGQASNLTTGTASLVFGTPAAIGQASNSTMNTASQVFGTPAAIGQASNLTTGSASQVFGTPAAIGQASNLTTGSASQVFGTPAAMGQASNLTTNTSSQVFGTPGSSSSSNLFGTNQSSIFISSNNQPSSNPFSVGTSSIPSLPTTGQSLFAPSVVSMQMATSEKNSLMSPSPFSAESSNVFGSFSQNSTSGSSTSGSVFGKLPSRGFRNMGSSEGFSCSNLFGKQETKSSALFEFNTSSSSTSQPFVVKQNSPAKTASSLFTGAVSSSSNPALTFSRDNQPGNLSLFGQKHAGSSIMRQVAQSVNLQPEFSKIKSSEHAQTAESVYKVINPVGDSVSSIQASKIPAITSRSASSNALFGDIAPASSTQSQERDTSDGLFKKSSVGRLFGKPVHVSGALFGKVSRSQDTTDKSQASSPPKSLSKWSRGKLIPDRKRREDTDSRTDYEGDAKKSKSYETGQTVSTPGLSSLRLSSVDDQLKTSLVVRDIPAHLNRVSVLRKHFSRFGTITRLQPLPMKKAANITFKTHDEAMAAKNDGKHISPDDPPMTIFWRAGSKLKSPDIKGNQVREFKKESVSPKRKPAPGSVEDELASMSELSPDFQQGTFSKVSKIDLPKVAPARKKSPSPPPTPQLQDVDIAKELLKNIQKARAKETSERVAVLDSRDKLLRLLRGRQQSDLATAKAFEGTCPDMCPEKERYYREETRRLAFYEVIPSTMTSLTGLKSKVDHMQAVKEYSRSSADQDEPLPHELRPLSVLMTTMNYLLTKIADLGQDGQWSEWYDFLWNRTRGIRKDITQQQLCSVQVAELLEKCARFHIFCSERLCEEDMMTFDAKINDENLTKCLQTLKELYDDLEKKGVICPNEAEFRSYVVLMHLNEGDILREIQQLRPEIRESSHISVAVQVYNALNANNYVRFFRLVEEKASFLSACIIHRYFNQIRSKALHIIMKSHVGMVKAVPYPVEEMIRLLCFEHAKEVEAFCYHYCLSLKGADVLLDAKAFTEPEGSLPQTRSQSLIEIKQENISVGEVINGSPLPPLHLAQPSSSFDQDGVFIMSSDILEAIESSKLFKSKHVHHPAPTIIEEADRKAERVQRESLMLSNEVVKSLTRTLILEVIDSSISEIAQETYNLAMKNWSVSVAITSEIRDIINGSIEESLRQVAEEVYKEEESLLRQKLEEELELQREIACKSICEEIVINTVDSMVKDVTDKEMSLVKAELHKQQLERCSQHYCEDLLCLVVNEMIEDVTSDVYEEDVVAKRERLEATEKTVKIMRCRRFLQAWRMKYLAQIKIKRAMLDFPSAPPSLSLMEQIHRLVPNRPDTRINQKSFFIGERSKLRIASPMDVIQEQLHLSVHLSMASARHMLDNLLLWQPLDMALIVGIPLQRTFKGWKDTGLIDPDAVCMQWKLVVSLPKKGPATLSEESTFTKWIRSKLCRSADRDKLLEAAPSYEGQVLSNYQLSKHSHKPTTVSTGVCVRCFSGAWTDNEEIGVKQKNLLKGTSAVVFILSTAESLHTQQQATWHRERQRLHQVLKQKPQSPAIPLVVIVPRALCSSSLSVKELDTNLQLSDLYRQELISAVHVAEPYIGDQTQLLQCCKEWTTQLTGCLKFAASNSPAPPKLLAKPISDYIEDIIVELYKSTVYGDLRARTRKQLLHQSPNTLLSLYNDVVDHAAMTSSSGPLTQISWPAPEFDNSSPREYPRSSWNTEAYLCDLYELLSKTRLPYFQYSDLEADDWSTVCQDVWAFVASISKKDGSFAKIVLHQQVAKLLYCCKKTFKQFCWLANKDGPCEPTYMNMAWTDLIDACIHYKLMSLRTGLISLRKEEDNDELTKEEPQEPDEVMVYYQGSELEDYEPPRRWEDALKSTEIEEAGLLKATIEKAAQDFEEDSMLDLMETSEAQLSSASFQQKQETDYTASNWDYIKMLLQEEKAATDNFEKSLDDCLSQNNLVQKESETSNSSIEAQLSSITAKNSASSHWLKSKSNKSVSFSVRKQMDISELCNDSSYTSHSFYYPLGGSSLFSNRRTSGVIRPDWESFSEDGRLSPTLSEKVQDLQYLVSSERKADVLFEMRLKSFIDPEFDTSEELHSS